MPSKTLDLLDLSDQIAIARNLADLIQMAHDAPASAPTATAAHQVSKMLKRVMDSLKEMDAGYVAVKK